MLPESTKAWLSEFDYPEYTQSIRANQSETKDILTELGIVVDSDIAEFYLNFGSLSATGWYELLEPRELKDTADYVHSDFDLPEHFLPLTHHEGGGFSLLDQNSGYVYDLVFEQIDDLIAETLDPVSKSFGDYLEWRRTRQNETA